MNKERIGKINNVKEKIFDYLSELENIKDDEEFYYDNIPENLQSSRNAERSEEAISLLEDAIDGIRSSIEILEDIL